MPGFLAELAGILGDALLAATPSDSGLLPDCSKKAPHDGCQMLTLRTPATDILHIPMAWILFLTLLPAL